MIGDATFRVLRATSRWCRFAAVTVEVSAANAPVVVVAPDANDYPAHRVEAAAGARHALRRLSAEGGGYRVAVTDIRATDVDTGVGDVHEATARAVWQAIGIVPQPAYVGFNEAETVAAWARDRIGLPIVAVTEARHWPRGGTDQDSSSLVHIWLHFHRGAPTRLHRHGDELLLSTGDPYPGYRVDAVGDIRVAPANPPDLLATVLGRRLINVALILGPTRERSCAGLVLRMDGAELVVGTCRNEWIITADRPPRRTEPSWHRQPWLA